jgi:uncharacterized RDD family membrane protein YckC
VPPGQPQWQGQPYPGAPSFGGGPRFAGFGARFGAWFIDALILSPFGILGRIVLSTGKKEIRSCGFVGNIPRYCEGPAGSTWALWGLITLAGFVVAILYYGLLEGRTGQTVGKRALGVSVVDVRTGAPIGVGRAIGRYFAKLLSAIPCFLGYFWMLWDPNKQTWHDKIVGSYVVTT